MQDKEVFHMKNKVMNIMNKSRDNLSAIADKELLQAYWKIGGKIVRYEEKNKLISNQEEILEQLSLELSTNFEKGFSKSNLRKIRLFYLKYDKYQIMTSNLGWLHYCELLDITDDNKRMFYERESNNLEWTVSELKYQISNSLYERVMTPVINSSDERMRRLFEEKINLMHRNNVMKNPFLLELLGVVRNNPTINCSLKESFKKHMKEYLLGLGYGFMYVGTEQRVKFDNTYHHIDMVFYNKPLKCYVLIELNITEINNDVENQFNKHLTYYEQEVNDVSDNKPIGIILGKDNDKFIARYELGGLSDNDFATISSYYFPSKEDLLEQVEKVMLNWNARNK